MSVNFTNQKFSFGDSEITREMFEDAWSFQHRVNLPLDWFSNPIDMSKVSDEQICKIVKTVESIIREKYPTMANKLFALIAHNGFTKDDENKIIFYKNENGVMWNEYWNLLREYAYDAGGTPITNDDLEEDDEDADVDDDEDLGDLGINQTAIATESFVADLRILRLDIDDILDSLPYNKALTMRLRAIDRKLADIADDFSSLKATIDFLGEQR